LGEFKIYRGDSLIEEIEWDRKQPKQLLMSILSHRGKRVAKEVLIDDLWPDEKPGIAENNFKTTLQRLRKSLEPIIHKDFGSSYIHLHEGSAFLDPGSCEVDVDHFTLLIKQGDAEEKKALRAGLETKPDAVTNALYEKVLQHLNINNDSTHRR